VTQDRFLFLSFVKVEMNIHEYIVWNVLMPDKVYVSKRTVDISEVNS
jgi:hypothetical protein